jgi:hypothetical protein
VQPTVRRCSRTPSARSNSSASAVAEASGRSRGRPVGPRLAGLDEDGGIEDARQLGRAGLRAAGVGELVAEVRPAVDLDQQVGELHPREALAGALEERAGVRLWGWRDQLALALEPIL